MQNSAEGARSVHLPGDDNLVDELKALRKGRGVRGVGVDARVGDALRAACAVEADDAADVVRRKVERFLVEMAQHLDKDVHIAVIAAFALHRDVCKPYLKDRLAWAKDRMDGLSDKTVRRRVDLGIERLAELIAAGRLAQPRSRPRWRTKDLRVAVTVERSAVEAFETRRIVAADDGVSDIDLAMTMTAPPDRAAIELEGMQFNVFYGGTLAERVMESSDRVGMSLILPRPLALGEEHDIALRVRLPSDYPMAPHVVCVPRYPCDAFDLHVKFADDLRPRHIGKLWDVYQRDVDDPATRTSAVPLDAAGEVHVRFDDLPTGRACGVRWAE